MLFRKFSALILLVTLLASACSPAAPPYRPLEATRVAPGEPHPVIIAPPPAPTQALYQPRNEAGESAADQVCCPPPPPPIQPYPHPTSAPEPSYPPFPAPDLEVNPFIDTRTDHLSTFAMDVDTASYTKVREQIFNNQLPAPDLVRVEEFVNFFNMEYPDPDSGAFSIHLEGGVAPFGHADAGAYLLKVGIQGKHIADFQRKDAVLTFVIDASGSMSDNNKMDMVKDGLRVLVDRLGQNDQIGIVAFSDEAWVVLEPTSLYYRDHILRAIDSLYPMQSTNTEAGMRVGYDLALRYYRDGAINRVVLASDGMANVGNTDPNVLVGYAREYYQRNVYLSTIGVGRAGYDDQFMEQLADNGNGNYSYLDSHQAAERIFSQDLNSTLQTIAKDAKIQVDFNPNAVYSYRLLGYENRAVADQDFRNDSVDAGEVGAGHSVTALYEVYLQPQFEGDQDIATVRVRYEDPDTHAVAETAKTVKRSEIAGDFARTSPRFQLAAAVAQYAELLRHSPYTWGESMNQVLGLARAVQYQLPYDVDVSEFVTLVERASWMAQ